LSNDIRPIPVTIPPADLWRLEAAAERRGIPLGRFLYQAALSVAGLPADDFKESLVVLHGQGATVKQIAARLGMTNLAVKDRIKHLGLIPVQTKQNRN